MTKSSAQDPGSTSVPLPAWLLDSLGPPPSTADKPIVVQKYGGSSVADPDRLKLVARRVSETVQQGNRVVVVVSAMGKTTDQLIALSRSVTQSPPRRELDMLISSGERISMALLAMALSDLGHDAISFTGSQSGILTNDRHSGARIIEIRPVRILDELERDRVVIVAGFQGMSYKREVTTLGRGGSDTSAVALAAALGASCDIVTDVDAVYDRDPNVDETARLYGVLNKHLEGRQFVAGDEYSIADMAIYPWIVPHTWQGQNLDDFPHLKVWFERIQERPATVRAYALVEKINPPQ